MTIKVIVENADTPGRKIVVTGIEQSVENPKVFSPKFEKVVDPGSKDTFFLAPGIQLVLAEKDK
jgi:hypothetical protein